MQAGQQVGFIGTNGERIPATIVEVTGAGPSNYKTLTVSFRRNGEDVIATDVPHENDAAPGEPFWLEKGVARKRVAAVEETRVEEPYVEPDDE